MISFLKLWRGRLRANQRGAVTIEFALWSVLFGMIALVALDFGLYMTHRLRLNSAVEQAAVFAFNTREKVNVVTVENLVTTSAHLKTAPTVKITCNGGTGVASCGTPRQCACVSGTAAAPTFTVKGPCGRTTPPLGACTDGSTPGHYMTIRAEATYSSLVVPNKYLHGTKMVEAATVRLR